MFNGDNDCRCSDDASDVLESLVARRCTTSSGQNGILLSAAGPCEPVTFGSGCASHDTTGQAVTSLCEKTFDNSCNRYWCYVENKDSCMSSPSHRVYRSKYFATANDGVDLFYAYTVCNSSDDLPSVPNPKQTLGGVTILTTTPQAYFPPYHYKRNGEGEILSLPGEEYWNVSIPYEGVMIDYLDQVQALADGDFTIEWTFGSKASRLVHPSSAYTASVQDIQDGLIDMAVGPIWVTGERLHMTTFTVPLYYSRTVLVVPKPGVNNSMQAQSSKVLAPFSIGVWLMIVAIIAITATLSVWFSGQKKKILTQARRVSMTRGETRESIAWQRKRTKHKLYARLFIDELLQKGTYFFSAGIEQDNGDSLPSKLLMFGFGFFILVVVSAYVANLAAFLTRNVPTYVGTIDEAISSNWRICALPATSEELEVAWPGANWIFSSSGKSYHSLLEDYDAGLCDGFIYGFANLELMNMLCKRDLVFTDSLVLENPVAWPIRPDYAAGLSYWIYQAEKYHGLKVESLKEEYDAANNIQPNCDVFFNPLESNAENEYAKISLVNLFLPFVFFFAFAILAASLHLYASRMTKKGRRGLIDSSYMGRTSVVGIGKYKSGRIKSTLDISDKLDEKEDEEIDNFGKQLRKRTVLSNKGLKSSESINNASLEEKDEFHECSEDVENLHTPEDEGSQIANNPGCKESQSAKSQLLDELFQRYMNIEQREKSVKWKQ